MATVRVRRVGNSNVLSIPRTTGLVEGDEVTVENQPDGSIRLRRPAVRDGVSFADMLWLNDRLADYDELLAYLRDH